MAQAKLLFTLPDFRPSSFNLTRPTRCFSKPWKITASPRAVDTDHPRTLDGDAVFSLELVEA